MLYYNEGMEMPIEKIEISKIIRDKYKTIHYLQEKGLLQKF